MSDEPTSLRIPDPGVRALYTIESRWQAWLDVEAALARAEAEVGMIPAAAAEAIAAKAHLDQLDRDRITEGLRRTGHQLVPLVWELSRVCDEDAARFVHWGATTQNITQTGELLLLRAAHRIFLAQLARILAACADLAERTRDYALPARTILDHLGEYAALMGLLAATCGRIGQEIYTGMKDEFGEVEEPWSPGTVGSSTMPQKRNPIFTQDILAGAARIRGLVPVALEAMQVEHEANRANSLLMRRALEPAAEILGDTLERVRIVLEGLTLDPERMRRNLDLSGGLILAEALMLKLGEHIGRQEAHDVIYDAAQGAGPDGRGFRDRLKGDPRVTAHLGPGEIEGLLDPTAYTGLSGRLADEQAARARSLAAEIEATLAGSPR